MQLPNVTDASDNVTSDISGEIIGSSARFPRIDKLDFDVDFDPRLDDFPRGSVPEFLGGLPESEYLRALGAAWLGYNEGVILGERDFVIPAAEIFALNEATKEYAEYFDTVAAEEEFHILGSMRACMAVRRQRDLRDLSFPTWQVAEALADVREAAERRGYAELAMLATCFTFEATISSSFSYLSRDRVIQPSHSGWVSLHAEDEADHTRLFLAVVPRFFGSLSYHDQNRFVQIINATVLAMCNPAGGVWPTIAGYFGLRYPGETVPDLVSPVTSLQKLPTVSRNLCRALTRPARHDLRLRRPGGLTRNVTAEAGTGDDT